MKKAMKILACAVVFILPLIGWAQAPQPQAMPPYYINNLNVNATNGIELYQSETIISTGNESEPVNITGTAKVDFKASKEVELKPGFTASDFTGDGEFHAYIEELPFEVAWFEPVDNVGVVPKYEKLELGIKLPEWVNDKIQDFLDCDPVAVNCENLLNSINPFDSAEISIDVDFYSPDNRTIRKYGFYYEEYERHSSTTSFNSAVSQSGLGIQINYPSNNIDSWERIPTEYNFRVRLAPDYVGYWKFNIKIWLGTTLLGEYDNGFFVEPQNVLEKGFVVLDNNSKYLKYSEPEAGSLFLVGENVDVFLEWLHPQSHDLQTEVIQGVIDGGGNFVELMMVPENFGIEREVMGNYASHASHLVYYNTNSNTHPNDDNYVLTRQMNAWELDQKINFIEDENIYCQIALDMPGMYVTTGDQKCNGEIQENFDWSWWSMNWNPPDYDYLDNNGQVQHYFKADCNPYNIQSETNWGRTLAFNQLLFFTDSDAKRYYKRKLRYISSRWGYSPHIISYEIHGEIDQEAINICWDNQTDRGIIRNWVDMASSYLKDYLHDPHLLTYSSVFATDDASAHFSDQPFDMENIDLINYSMYNHGSTRDGSLRKAEQYNMHKVKFPGKAEFIGEYGGLEVVHCDDLGYHNDLWATAFMGNIGTANHWDWNKHYYYGRFSEFSALSSFMEGVDFEWNNFTPFHGAETYTLPLDFNGTDNRIEYFYLKNQYNSQAMGWVHNRSAYWANMEPDCSYFSDTDNNSATPDEEIFCPNDDQDCSETTNSIYTIPQNVLVFEGLEYPIVYFLQWYDTYTGEYIGSPQELTTFPTGTAIIPLPDLTEVYDYAFKIWPSGPDGFRNNSVSENTDTLKICENTNIASLSFLWNGSDNQFFINKREVADSFIFASTGTYNLKIIDRQDTISYCVQVYDCEVLQSVYSGKNNNDKQWLGLNSEMNLELSFKIYPIPAKDFIIIETNNVAGSFDCEISDIAGSIVYQQSFTNSRNIVNTELLARGAYVITLSKNDIDFHQRIILQ